MTEITLANRRHDTERVKKKRLKNNFTGHKTAETPALCSCWMCGNPRKWFKKFTIQERRFFQSSEE